MHRFVKLKIKKCHIFTIKKPFTLPLVSGLRAKRCFRRFPLISRGIHERSLTLGKCNCHWGSCNNQLLFDFNNILKHKFNENWLLFKFSLVQRQMKLFTNLFLSLLVSWHCSRYRPGSYMNTVDCNM